MARSVDGRLEGTFAQRGLAQSMSRELHPRGDAAPEGVREAVVAGFVVWFVFDSLGSIASGHPSNAAFDLFFPTIGVGPMWRPVPRTIAV